MLDSKSFYGAKCRALRAAISKVIAARGEFSLVTEIEHKYGDRAYISTLETLDLEFETLLAALRGELEATEVLERSAQ